jgi:hypothetical protein
MSEFITVRIYWKKIIKGCWFIQYIKYPVTINVFTLSYASILGYFYEGMRHQFNNVNSINDDTIFLISFDMLLSLLRSGEYVKSQKGSSRSFLSSTIICINICNNIM